MVFGRTPTQLPVRLVARDVAIAAITAALWWLDVRATSGLLGVGIAIAAGAMTAYAGFLAHEWGHLAAARASGSVVSYPSTLFSSLLFHFDSAQNDRRRFFWMSAGGYLASLVGAAIIFAFTPPRLSGWVACGLTSLGVLATFVLEVPITLRVLRGEPLPMDTAYRPHEP